VADEGTEKGTEPTNPIDAVTWTIDRFVTSAKVETVYGTPVKSGDTLVIPTAEVLSFAGLGAGSGGNNTGGSGGAGRTLARPVAAVVITPDGVRVEPIVDVTKVWMAGLTTLGFVFAMMVRMRKRRARKIQMSDS
jgi:uncharacterized spore protein YtfJ